MCVYVRARVCGQFPVIILYHSSIRRDEDKSETDIQEKQQQKKNTERLREADTWKRTDAGDGETSGLQLEQRVLLQKLVHRTGVQRQFGAIVKLSHAIRVAGRVLQLEANVVHPNL